MSTYVLSQKKNWADFVALFEGRGVSHALLRDAIEYVRVNGAEVVEGYPLDSAGISATHGGHSSVFKEAGFRPDGRRWILEL
jgi:hypothetical protein